MAKRLFYFLLFTSSADTRVYRERSHTTGRKRVSVKRHGGRESVVPEEQGHNSSGLCCIPDRRNPIRTHRDRVTAKVAIPIQSFIVTVHGGDDSVAFQRCGQGMPCVGRITLEDRVWRTTLHTP